MKTNGSGVCPACGQPADRDALFCVKCGKALPVPAAGIDTRLLHTGSTRRAAAGGESENERRYHRLLTGWIILLSLLIALFLLFLLFGSGGISDGIAIFLFLMFPVIFIGGLVLVISAARKRKSNP